MLKSIIKWISELLQRLGGGRSHRETHRKMLAKYKPQAKLDKPSPPDFEEEEYSIIETTPPPVQETPHDEFILDIRNADEMEAYSAKLNNLRGFDDFRIPMTSMKTRLDRVENVLSSLSSYNDFDEEFNFKLATKVVIKVAKQMIDIYSDAKESTHIDEHSRQKIMTLVEDYLSGIGVTQKIFHVGDDFRDWADLGMEDSHITIPTKDRALVGTIAAVDIQPHVIVYRNDVGEPAPLIFKGLCRVYKFKED
ncbi:MAG: hypothetical protein IKZ53_06825 [Selenomonadaceae bacterium]|nr:hypothetical protein [Selenomonadaceae bacterium]